jgi:hypothetical protein
MSFQLMAFFIFTYNPSALEGQFPITLAAGESGGPNTPRPDQVAQPKERTETKPAITVRARARDKGQLGSLEIITGGRTEHIKPAEGESASNQSVEMLLAQLEAKLWQYRADDDRIQLQGSIGLRWEDSMKVMDSCRQTTQLLQLKRAGKLQQYFPGLKLPGDEPVKLFPKIEMDLIRASPASAETGGS